MSGSVITNNIAADRIAKQRFNVIMVVDCSTSMRGARMSQVNGALCDVKKYLTELQDENANVDFYLTVITYSTEAFFLNGDKCKPIKEFEFNAIRGGGWSNLHTAYDKLADILLMTDGHPTKFPLKDEMTALKNLPWFNVALKYGIAIELNDKRTKDCLAEFVSGNGDVIECYDAKLLERIIKIIVLTASKVRSSSTNVHSDTSVTVNDEIKQQVQYAISEVDDWEW